MIDKRGLLEHPADLRGVTVELGCGSRKRYPGSIGVDHSDEPAVDIVGDALEVLRDLPAGCARLVSSSHFLEHVADPAPLLDEMSRLLAPDGEIEIVVPHFSHPYYHSDPTHASRGGFGLYTMSYFARDDRFARRVPAYVRRQQLTLKAVDLRFKSAVEFPLRNGLKRLLGLLFNSCAYMQELWEENLAYVFPCYEIRYVLGRSVDRAR